MDDQRIIGARMRQARYRKGLTQVDLATAIGISRAHLTNAERGHGGLAPEKLSLLAAETETTVAWLIGEAPLVVAADKERTEAIADYDSLDDEQRQAVRTILKTMVGQRKAEAATQPPTIPRRNASSRPKGPEPPHPTAGGRGQENRVGGDCAGNVRPLRVPAGA